MTGCVRGFLAVLATPLLLSCASGGGSQPLDDYSIRYRAAASGYRYTFESSADRIVETLPDVYGLRTFARGGARPNPEKIPDTHAGS